MTMTMATTQPLGPGPMRFALIDERHVQVQIDTLSRAEYECFEETKRKWLKHGAFRLSDEMILRFVRNSPGREAFNKKTAWNVMKHYNKRHLELCAVDLEELLGVHGELEAESRRRGLCH